MSLIFLKNDDASVSSAGADMMKPYKWSNYFTNPIKIAPNSQVAYIKSLTHSTDVGSSVDADDVRLQIGIPELNAPMKLELSKDPIIDFVGYINSIGEQSNNFNSDGDFNHILEKADQSINGGSILQTDFASGFNFYSTDDKKVNIRCVQREINDVFNQSFNSLGVIEPQLAGAPNGTNLGTGDDLTQFDESRFIVLNAPNGNPYNDPTRLGNPTTNSTAFPVDNTQDFYNCNFAYNQISFPPAEPYINTFDAGNIVQTNLATFDAGHYGAIMSATGIKKNVFMSAPPTANGGGHASISATGSGGYAICGFKNQEQVECDIAYPSNYFAGRGGAFGIMPISFGVHSVQFIDDAFNEDTGGSRAEFLANCDINASAQTGAGSNVNFTQALQNNARYLFGLDIQVVSGELYGIVRVLAPQSNIFESAYINTKTFSISEIASGYEPIKGNAFQGGSRTGPALFHLNTASTTAGKIPARLWFRFRWTSPYTMALEYCLSVSGAGNSYSVDNDTPFEPDDGSNTDPTREWIMIYDMKTDPNNGNNYLIPSYMGDMRVVAYPSQYSNNGFITKGYYDVRTSYKGKSSVNNRKDLMNLDFFWDVSPSATHPQDGVLVQNFSNPNAFTTPKLGSQKGDVVPEEFVATGTNAGFSKKRIGFLLNEIVDAGTLDKMMKCSGADFFLINQPPNLHLGRQLGLITNKTTAKDFVPLSVDILGSGNDFVVYGVNGTGLYTTGSEDFTLHFQLTNFAIQSQQGVKSTQNKTIAVVNNLEILNQEISNYTAHAHSSHYPNWIDLNNYGALNVNRIDVLITDDDNKPALQLTNKSSMVIAIRAKPKRDEGYVPDNIPVINRM